MLTLIKEIWKTGDTWPIFMTPFRPD